MLTDSGLIKPGSNAFKDYVKLQTESMMPAVSVCVAYTVNFRLNLKHGTSSKGVSLAEWSYNLFNFK